MRISISKYLRQHLLHIQSSSLKLRHMFKFNTKRSTIAGSECETFEGTEYRSQSVCKNHSPYVKSLCNRHIKQYSHMDTSIFTHASITTTNTVQVTHFISNFHPNPLISMNRTYTLLSASRSRTKLDDGTQGFTKFTEDWTWRDCQSYVTTILNNFRFPHSAFAIFGAEHDNQLYLRYHSTYPSSSMSPHRYHRGQR